MELFSNQSLVPLIGALLLGCVLGFIVGSARALRKRQRLQRELNTQTVTALENKTRLKKFKHILTDAKKKDRTVKILAKKLQASNAENGKLSSTLQTIERQHYIKQARLKMETAEAKQQAKTAVSIAQKSRKHIQHLQFAIRAKESENSIRRGQSVPVDVVNPHPPLARRAGITQVSDSDSHKLTQLKSSNEERLSGHTLATAPVGAASLTHVVKKPSTLRNTRSEKDDRLSAKRNVKSGISPLN